MDGTDGKRREDVFSKPVKAGKRTYFFDVKATRGNDFYITITESKRRIDDNGKFHYDKHKLFLYKEDFEKFADGLNEVIDYIKQEKGETFKESSSYSSSDEEVVESSNTSSDDYSSDISFDDLEDDK